MFQCLMPRNCAQYVAVFALFVPCLAMAQGQLTQNVVETGATTPVAQPRYAQLVNLAESAPLVVVAQARGALRVEGARAGNVPSGQARVYIEAVGLTALRGVMPEGLELRYLANLPLDAKGRTANLKKAKLVLFARATSGGMGEIQLITADGQLAWNADLEQRLRAIIDELTAPGAPPIITGVNMALYQQGNLVGEGETQIFLTTSTGTPAAIIVQHKVGQAPRWSLSLSEVVDASGVPPQRDTLAWYRLACALPESLPAAADVGDSPEARERAAQDYSLVRRDLGACGL
jgi:hypothetical protein